MVCQSRGGMIAARTKSSLHMRTKTKCMWGGPGRCNLESLTGHIPKSVGSVVVGFRLVKRLATSPVYNEASGGHFL